MLTDQDITEYLSGTSARKLGEKYNINHKIILQELRNRNVTIRTKQEANKLRTIQLTADQIQRYTDGVSASTLAKEMSCDIGTVIKALRRVGISTRTVSEGTKLAYQHTDLAKKLSASHQGIPLADWTGFKGTEDQRERKTQAALDWRLAIFERDNYTCVWCGKRGGKLNAHHIRRWVDYPTLRFDLTNGVTLCKACHKAIYYREQTVEEMFSLYVSSLSSP